jgi:ClpP class serine protease
VSFFDLIWVFFIVMSLQPVLRQRWLEAQRLRAFRRVEEQRNSRVIGLIHRQETMSFFGFPIARFIDIQGSEELRGQSS